MVRMLSMRLFVRAVDMCLLAAFMVVKMEMEARWAVQVLVAVMPLTMMHVERCGFVSRKHLLCVP